MAAADSFRPERALVLWDGDCTVCGRFAIWCERRDLHQELHLVPYQAAPSPPMTVQLAKACELALHVVLPGGKILRAGQALLFVYGRLGWPKTTRFLAHWPLIVVVEFGYRCFARYRHSWGRYFFRSQESR